MKAMEKAGEIKIDGRFVKMAYTAKASPGGFSEAIEQARWLSGNTGATAATGNAGSRINFIALAAINSLTTLFFKDIH